MTSKRKSRASRRRPPKAGRKPSYANLSAHEKATYDRTTNLITDLRRGEGSYTALLRKHHLGSRTARKYAGRDLLGGTRGKPLRASKADRRVRDLLFPMPSGDVPIRTRNSRDATKLSDYYNDRDKLLGNKMSAEEFETKWDGVRITGEEVLADATTILEMEDADVLRMESLYASVGQAE